MAPSYRQAPARSSRADARARRSSCNSTSSRDAPKRAAAWRSDASRGSSLTAARYQALARLYLSDQKADEAIKQIEAGLERNPKEKGFHMLIGTIYDLKKQPGESEKQYRAELEHLAEVVAIAEDAHTRQPPAN